jgi:hypothetical protein
MAQCIKCQKKGLFLKTAKNGLCESCDAEYQKVLKSRGFAIKMAEEWLHDLDPITVATWHDRLEEYVNDLLVYEKLGVLKVNPTPSEYLKTIAAERDDNILNALTDDFKHHVSKTYERKTIKGRLTYLNKFYSRIDQIKPYFRDPSRTDQLLTKLQSLEVEISKQ